MKSVRTTNKYGTFTYKPSPLLAHLTEFARVRKEELPSLTPERGRLATNAEYDEGSIWYQFIPAFEIDSRTGGERILDIPPKKEAQHIRKYAPHWYDQFPKGEEFASIRYKGLKAIIERKPHFVGVEIFHEDFEKLLNVSKVRKLCKKNVMYSEPHATFKISLISGSKENRVAEALKVLAFYFPAA